MDRFAEGMLWYVVFLFSTTCHEAARALMALKLGDRTAYGGQTLDPRPHIQRETGGNGDFPDFVVFDGWVMIGWASAPYDPYWALRYPKRSALRILWPAHKSGAGASGVWGFAQESPQMFCTRQIRSAFLRRLRCQCRRLDSDCQSSEHFLFVKPDLRCV